MRHSGYIMDITSLPKENQEKIVELMGDTPFKLKKVVYTAAKHIGQNTSSSDVYQWYKKRRGRFFTCVFKSLYLDKKRHILSADVCIEGERYFLHLSESTGGVTRHTLKKTLTKGGIDNHPFECKVTCNPYCL